MIKIFLIFSFCCIFIFCNCSSKADKVTDNPVKFGEELLISSGQMKKGGINCIESRELSLVKTTECYYLLSIREKALVKFDKSGTPLYRYNAAGQGPGEFMRPIVVFRLKDGNPAVYDAMKSVVFCFNKKLELKKEVIVDSSTRYIGNVNGKLIAFGSFGDNCFAVLDNNLSIIEKFGNIPDEAPFKRVHRIFLYIGFFLNNELAYSSFGQYKDNCKVDILNPSDGSTRINMKWRNPHKPDQEDIDRLKNLYYCFKVAVTDKYYLVQTRFTPALREGVRRQVRIFTKSGVSVNTIDIGFDFINSDTGMPVCINEKENLVKLLIQSKVQK